MLKKTVTYTDFNDISRTEDLYFNLTRTEAIEFAIDMVDGAAITTGDKSIDVQQAMHIITEQLEGNGAFQFIKKLLLKSYGVKTADGKFKKDDKTRENFEYSAAFDAIFMEFMHDDKKAAEFVNNVIPSSLADGIPETN